MGSTRRKKEKPLLVGWGLENRALAGAKARAGVVC